MDMGLVANERGRQTVYSIRRLDFFKVITAILVQGRRGLPRDLRPETTKLVGGKSRIMSHGSMQRIARDMGVAANERTRQTTYSVKRLNFFKVILATWGGGMSKNWPIFEVLGPRSQVQTSYGHGGWCI